MAKQTRSPAVLRDKASAAVAALQTLAATPSPDAGLVTACDRFLVLTERADRLYRLEPRGYMKRIRAMLGERDILEVEIAKTPARTVVGMLAKAEVADRMLGSGTMANIPRSVLNDFIRNASGGNDVTAGATPKEPPDLEEV